MDDVRTHLILPDELVEEIDRLVGKRKRSRFIVEALREKVRRETLLDALRETAGMLTEDEHPEWATSQRAAAWVRQSRQRDDERLRRTWPSTS